jgi:hypothetical protein
VSHRREHPAVNARTASLTLVFAIHATRALRKSGRPHGRTYVAFGVFRCARSGPKV